MTFEGQTWWLIGASEGLGRAICQHMTAKGATMILSARSKDRLRELCEGNDGCSALPLDVTDPRSVKNSFDLAQKADGVIYCAGFYEPVSAPAWDADAVERMIDVNFTGAVRVLSHIVPHFTRRGHGRIMLIGSLSGYRGLPGAVGYGASKAALMHLAENLLVDLDGTGVSVQIANPGFIDTRLTKKNDFDMPQMMPPDAAARHVVRALERKTFETAFPRPFAWLFTMGRYLPRAWFNRIFK